MQRVAFDDDRPCGHGDPDAWLAHWEGQKRVSFLGWPVGTGMACGVAEEGEGCWKRIEPGERLRAPQSVA